MKPGIFNFSIYSFSLNILLLFLPYLPQKVEISNILLEIFETLVVSNLLFSAHLLQCFLFHFYLRLTIDFSNYNIYSFFFHDDNASFFSYVENIKI